MNVQRNMSMNSGKQIDEVKAQLEGIITVVRTSPAIKVGNALIEHGRIIDEEK